MSNHRISARRGVRLAVAASALVALGNQGCASAVDEPQESRATQTRALSANQLFGTSLPAKTLALTFDDGPGEYATYDGQDGQGTGISQYLKSLGIRAAFFDIGGHVATTTLPNPLGISVTPHASTILAQIVSDGHLIGNHTTTHRDLVTEVLPDGASQVVAELTQANTALSSYLTPGALLFRAPYVDYDQAVNNALAGSPVNVYVGPVDADIGGVDNNYPYQAADWACWQGQETYSDGTPAGSAGTGYLTTKECGDAYIAEIKSVDHGIVLMHEPFSWNNGNTLAMIQYMVPILQADGYSFVRVDEVPDIRNALGTCNPICNGLACGDDGCGGSCGTCAAGQTCTAGACVATGGGGGGTCAWNPTWAESSGANTWWVEYTVTGGTVSSAYLQVVGGGTVTLSNDGWNKWVGPSSFVIPKGTSVVVHAQNSLAQTAVTQPFAYLTVTSPVTTCATACTPSCAGLSCGTDGCGGSCGTCVAGTTCTAGACVANAGGGGGTCAWDPTWSEGSGANTWWVEYTVTGGTIDSAYLEVPGSGNVTLSLDDWNKWVGPSSFVIPKGTSVLAHAVNSLNQDAATAPFAYLTVTAPVTACAD